MNRKTMLTIIPLIGVAAIPQLIYFWLAPDVSCSLTIYIFGTTFTFIHITLCFVLMWKFSTRRVAATIITSSIIFLITLIISAFLLLFDVTIRTTIYSLSILSVLYSICTLSLFFAIEPTQTLHSKSTMPISDLIQRVPITKKNLNKFHMGQHDENSGINQLPPPLPEKR